MRHLLLITLFLISAVGFSQTESIKTIFKKAAPKETVKITMDVSQYEVNIIALFKEKLSTLKDKIELVHYDDSSSTLAIVYNNNMTLEYFIKVFDEFKISYLIKNPAINSK